MVSCYRGVRSLAWRLLASVVSTIRRHNGVVKLIQRETWCLFSRINDLSTLHRQRVSLEHKTVSLPRSCLGEIRVKSKLSLLIDPENAFKIRHGNLFRLVRSLNVHRFLELMSHGSTRRLHSIFQKNNIGGLQSTTYLDSLRKTTFDMSRFKGRVRKIDRSIKCLAHTIGTKATNSTRRHTF